MLSDKTSSAIIAVSDMGRSKIFYGTTLGLSFAKESDGVMVHATGASHRVVYRSDEAGTNRAKAVVFDAAGEIDAIVAALANKGVVFGRYEMDETSYRDGIHHANGMKVVWFKEPDGNILHINDMTGSAAEAEASQ